MTVMAMREKERREKLDAQVAHAEQQQLKVAEILSELEGFVSQLDQVAQNVRENLSGE